MKVAVVFGPDPDLGPDPNDPHKRARRLGEFFDSDTLDMILIVRQYDEQFEDGHETQFFSSGIWESLSADAVGGAIDDLSALESNDGQED